MNRIFSLFRMRHSRISQIVILALLILILWGGFLRFYRLGEQSLWIDEAYTLNASSAIIDHGYPILPSGKTYRNGPLSTYVSALFMKAFPFDPFSPMSVRIPAAAFGTLLIAATFFLARALFKGNFVTLSSAAVIAFLNWEVAWSRQARGYTMLAFFLVAALFFALRYVESKRKSHFWVSIGSIILACLSHGLGLVFIPPYAAFMTYHAFHGNPKRARLVSIISTLSLFVLVFAASVFNYEKVRPFAYYFRYFEFLLGYLLPLTILAMFGGVFAISSKDRENEKKSTLVLSIFIILPFVLISIASPFTQYRYLFPLVPFLAILGSYAALRAGKAIESIWKGSGATAGAILLLAALFSLLLFFPRPMLYLEPGSPQPDFKGAFSFIKSERAKGDVLISAYAPLQKIYLGDRGLWLVMSTGAREERERKVINGADYYTGAPAIKDMAELRRILGENHGFVVMDSMTRLRLVEAWLLLTSDSRSKLVFESRSNNLESSVWVFKF